MRITSIVAISGAGLMLLSACSGGETTAENASTTSAAPAEAESAAAGNAMPKAGLWEMKITAAAMPQPQTTKLCVGETAANSNPFAPPPTPGQTCARNNVTKTATGYSIDMECSANGMTMTSIGTVSGDMASAYKVEMATKIGGANVPAAAQQEMKTVIDAKYLGDCPADMQPGQTQS